MEPIIGEAMRALINNKAVRYFINNKVVLALTKSLWLSVFISCEVAFAGLLFLSPIKTVISDGFQELHSGDFVPASTSYVDMGSPAALNINADASPLSISFWFYGTNLASGFQQMITKRDVGVTGIGIEIGEDGSGDIITELAGPGGRMEITWGAALADDTWYFMVLGTNGSGTAAGTTVTLCSNGSCAVPSKTVNSDLLSGTTASLAPFRVGSRNNSTLLWNGQIDEVAYWDADVTASASALYNLGTPTDLSAAANIVSWWRFENSNLSPVDSSATIFDRISVNNGTNNVVGFSTNVP